MAYVTQSRPLEGTVLPPYKYYYGDYTYASAAGYRTLDGSQTTYSWRTSKEKSAENEYEQMSGTDLRKEINREYRDRNDTGHEFWTEKSTWSWSTPHITGSLSNGVVYDGLLDVAVYGSVLPDFSLPTTSQKNVDGTEGVRRTFPTRPEAGLATFLGELRQELPHLPGALLAGLARREKHIPVPKKLTRNPGKANAGSALGDEYLNWSFGIMPTESDLKRLAQAVLNTQKVLDQLQRDSGRAVRRRARIRSDSSTGVAPDQPISLSVGSISGTVRPAGFLNNYDPNCVVVDETASTVWFSGAYEYHLAAAHSAVGKMARYEQQANKLLGTRITPEVIWELTPWSWLIDWFSDIGSIMTNISALTGDDLVLKYGYVMHETRATRTWTSRSDIKDGQGHSVAPSLILSHSYHRKERTRATPYGFGVDVSGLSPRRWAILGALGLSRSPGKLRND